MSLISLISLSFRVRFSFVALSLSRRLADSWWSSGCDWSSREPDLGLEPTRGLTCLYLALRSYEDLSSYVSYKADEF